MKVKNHIRQDVSQTFDLLIPEGKWDEYMDLLDRDGHPNRRELLSLILSFCKHIETLEELVEDLYFKQDLLEGKSDAKAPVAPAFKLRTPVDIAGDLQTIMTPETKRFYLSESDWKVLEKNVNPELAKTKPEYGYGKDIDPKDNTEKVVLYYKDLPVFKK